MRSFIRLQQVDPGFIRSQAVVARLALPGKKYPEPADTYRFYRRLIERIAHLPGVRAAGATASMPFADDYVSGVTIDGRPRLLPAERPPANYYSVSPGYFEAMGIRLLSGRFFTEQDAPGAPRVGIINETFAKRLFPGEDPIGKRVQVDMGGPDAWREIVGIVADTKQYGLTQDAASKSNPTTVGVTDSKGQTQYNFYYSTNSWLWSDGLLQRAQRKTTGGQVRRTQDMVWTQDDPAQIFKLNPRVTSRTTTLDNGLSTRADFEYVSDSSGNVRQVSEYGFDAALLRRTVTQYWYETYPAYANLNLTGLASSVSVRDAAGAEVSRIEYFYDEYALTGYGGNITNHDPAYGSSFTTRGNATSVRRYYQEGGRYVGTTMSYDIVGNMVSTTDARGNTTSTTYGWSYAFPYRVTNALGHVTEYTWSQEPIYDNGNLVGYGPALLTSLKDPNGVLVSEYWYDDLSRVVQKRIPTDIYNNNFDDASYLTTSSSSSGFGYTTSNPTGQVLKQEHTDPSEDNLMQKTTYDAWGRVVSQTVPYRGEGGPAASYSYDSLGRVRTYSVPGQGSGTNDYSGNEVTATDNNGRRKNTYDALGRLVKVTEEDAQGNLNVETAYEYDLLGRLKRIVQGAQTRMFVYDSLGRLVADGHPESGAGAYSYDDNGNVASRTDARGVVTANTYDALNRLTGTSYSDGTPAATFSYDQTSSSLIGLITNGKGRRTSAWTSDGIGYSWSYDTSGRALRQVFKIDGAIYGVDYSYTPQGCGCTNGDLMQILYPGGFEVKYERDAALRVIKISSPVVFNGPHDFIQEIDYGSPGGAIAVIKYGTDNQDTFSYGGVVLSQYDALRPEGGFFRWNYTYSGDRVTRIDEQKRTRFGYPIYSSTFTYSYDRWGRLGTARRDYDDGYGNWQTDWNQGFSYDRYNNLTSGFTVDAATNRLISFGNPPTSVGYDQSGHMVTQGDKTYNWDGADRLKEMRRTPDNGLQGGNRYDAMGRRVKRNWDYVSGSQQQTGSEIYLYGASGELLGEYRNVTAGPNGAETVTTYNILLNGQMVAKRVLGTNQVTGSFRSVDSYMRNHLGEPILRHRALTWPPASGLPAWGTYTQPYDSRASDQFPRHKYDAEASLKYFGARYYQPGTSRWISPDAIMPQPYDPQSLNRYAYVRNDPVNLVDPDGKFWMVAYNGGEPAYAYWDNTPWQQRRVPSWYAEEHDPPQNDIPWDIFKYEECKNALTKYGGVRSGLIPSEEATRWLMEAWRLHGNDPAVLGAIWFTESSYKLDPIPSANWAKDPETGENLYIFSWDYGPLQINDKWRLDSSTWQSRYNPHGFDLKNWPFMSFLAGAKDLADSLRRSQPSNWLTAAVKWHGRGAPDMADYLLRAGQANGVLKEFFGCLHR